MKKGVFLLLSTLFLPLLLTGCQLTQEKDSADKYLGEQITNIKEKDSEKLAFLLEEGIRESNGKYTLQFPEELKKPYLSFLQKALQTVEFRIPEAKKNGKDIYTVQVYYTPIDIAGTMADAENTFPASMASSDLNDEATHFLEQTKETLDQSPRYKEETYSTLSVSKTDAGFHIAEEELEKLLSRALEAYMAPYDNVCELLNVQNFLQSYLDASFKGDVGQFALHTGRTKEEALKWYHSDAFLPDLDMDSSYKKRYTKALKKILKQCVYSVGIPKKESGIYNYTTDVTVKPNNSLADIFSEWKKGTYYSEEEVSRTLVELLEKYADSPSYGKKKVITIQLNSGTLMDAGKEGAELTNLAREILPLGTG